MDKITACLIVYKRQRHLGKIIDSLVKWPFISEVMVRDNSKSENIINHGRYTLGEKAENDYIYTQDDDCIVHNLDELYETFMKDPTKIAHCGTEGYESVIDDNIYPICSEEDIELVSKMKMNHVEKKEELMRRAKEIRQMAMFGWGTIFDKSWIPLLDKYTAKYGKDHCFYRETDRIFSLLKGGYHSFVLGDIEHLDGYNGEEALSSQGEHLKYKKLAIERALKCSQVS